MNQFVSKSPKSGELFKAGIGIKLSLLLPLWTTLAVPSKMLNCLDVEEFSGYKYSVRGT